MHLKYCCKKCLHLWQGRKNTTRCPKCKTLEIKVGLNYDFYSRLDDAAERFAKMEAAKTTHSKGK